MGISDLRHWARCGPLLFTAGALWVTPGLAAEDPQVPAETPPVGLERLLVLPDSLRYGVERRGGSTQGEWRERFREAQAELEEARSALAASQTKLEGLGESSDAWLLTPPGGGTQSDAPLSYQLKVQIRRQREEVSRAEKRLRDLQIEANLANVPEEWRH